MTDQSSELYDLHLLRENSNHDNDFILTIISMFKKTGDNNVELLSKNCTAGHCHDWIEAAHSLKGGAGMIGAEKLRSLAATAQQAEDTTAKHRLELFTAIKDTYTKTCDALVRDGLLSS